MGSAIFCGLLVPGGLFLTYLNRIPAQVNPFEQQLKSADFADYADRKDRGAGAVSRGRTQKSIHLFLRLPAAPAPPSAILPEKSTNGSR